MASDGPWLDADVAPQRLAGDVPPMLVRHIGRVSAIFDGAPIGVALWSCEGRLLHANPVMCGLLQRRLDDLAGEPIASFLEPDQENTVDGMVAEVASGARAAFEWPFRCRQPNGKDRWLRAHVTGIYGGGSSPEYVISQIFSFVDVRSEPPPGVSAGVGRAVPAEAVSRWDKARQTARPGLPHKRWSDDVPTDRFDVLADLPVAVAVCDHTGGLKNVNGRWTAIFSEQNSGNWFGGVTNEDAKDLRDQIAIVAATLQPFTKMVLVSGRPSHELSSDPSQGGGPSAAVVDSDSDPGVQGYSWFDITLTPLAGEGPQVDVILTAVGVPASGAVQAAVPAASTDGSRISRLVHALDASSDLLLFIEADLSISYANDAAVEMLGLPTSDDPSGSSTNLMEVLEGEATELFQDVVRPALVFDSIWRGELDMKAADGTLVAVSVVMQANMERDGRIGSMTVVARDITDLKRAQIKLQALATHDYLTGLANRVLLYSRLEQALARFERYGHPVALMYVDLDEFKPVNDSLGHHVGDEVLMAVADRIHSVIRETDSAARIGGDEFAILIEGVDDVDRHARMAARLIRVISEPVVISGVSARVGASIGIVQADRLGTTADSLMALADRAMYRAKSAGRGCSIIVDGNGDVIA